MEFIVVNITEDTVRIWDGDEQYMTLHLTGHDHKVGDRVVLMLLPASAVAR